MYSIISFEGTHRKSLKGYTSTDDLELPDKVPPYHSFRSIILNTILPWHCPLELCSMTLLVAPSRSSAMVGPMSVTFPPYSASSSSPQFCLNSSPSLEYTFFYTTNMKIWHCPHTIQTLYRNIRSDSKHTSRELPGMWKPLNWLLFLPKGLESTGVLYKQMNIRLKGDKKKCSKVPKSSNGI